MLRAVASLASLALLLGASSSRAATFHVATTGDDTTGDGSASAPWRTIAKAVNSGVSAAGGHLILVADGVYEGMTTVQRGFPARVVVRAEHAHRSKLTNVAGGAEAVRVYVVGSANVTLEGFVISNQHPSYTCPAGRETYYLVHIQDASDVTLRDNIIFGANAPGTCNEVVKVNRSLDTVYFRNVVVEGNVLYAQANAPGADLIDSVRPGELDVLDNVFFGDPAKNQSQSFITIKRQAPPPVDPRSPRYRVAGNIFLNWGGLADQAFLQFGEDGVAEWEVSDALVENNLFIGNSPASMAAPMQFKGVHGIHVRANTIVGDLPSGAFGFRIGTEGLNLQIGDIRIANNIFCDSTGTMTNRLVNTYGDVDLGSVTLDHNLFWNAGNALPTTGGVLPTADPARVVADPLLATDQSGLVLPIWNETSFQFASGTTTIAEERARLIAAYGTLGVGSAAVSAATASDMPAGDIRGLARDLTPDTGAFERDAATPVPDGGSEDGAAADGVSGDAGDHSELTDGAQPADVAVTAGDPGGEGARAPGLASGCACAARTPLWLWVVALAFVSPLACGWRRRRG